MKKLIMILSSISLFSNVPLMTESFGLNSTINSKINSKSLLNSSYSTIDNTLSQDFIALEYCNAAVKNGSQEQLVFGLSDNKRDVYLIKTNPYNGSSNTEKIYTSSSDIYSIIGRQNKLFILNQENEITLDFSNASSFESKSTGDTWFTDFTKNDSNEVKKTVSTYSDFLHVDNVRLGDGIGVLYVLPKSNLITYISISFQKLYMCFLDPFTGEIDKSDNPNIKMPISITSRDSLLNNWTGVQSFMVNSSKKDQSYVFGKYKNDKDGFYFEDLSSSEDARKVSFINEKDEAVDLKHYPLFIDDGFWQYISVNNKLYLFNSNSIDISANTIKLKNDPSLVADSDIDFIKPVTFNGQSSLLYGTDSGVYLSDFKDNGDDDHTEIITNSVKISDEKIQYPDDTNLNVAAVANNKIYIKNNSNVSLLAKNIDISLDSNPVDVTDDWSDGENASTLSFDEKVERIYNLISKTNKNILDDFAYSDFYRALWNRKDDLDKFGSIYNYATDLPPYEFNLSSKDCEWFTGELHLIYGKKAEDKISDLVNKIITSLTSFDVSGLNIFSSIDEINAKVGKQVEDKLKANDTLMSYLDNDFSNLEYSFDTIKNLNDTDLKFKPTVKNEVAFKINFKDGFGNHVSSTWNTNLVNFAKGEVNFSSTTNLSDFDDKDVAKVKIENLSNIKNYYGNDFSLDSFLNVSFNSCKFTPYVKEEDVNNGELKDSTETISGQDMSKYFDISLEGDYLCVTFKSQDKLGTFDGSISIEPKDSTLININTNKLSFNGTFKTAAPLPASKSIPWKIILIVLGSILLILLLAFLIFALIKWIIPAIKDKVSNRSKKVKKVKKIDKRIPQKTSDANAVRHSKKISIKTARENLDGGIVRSGIFKREIDINENKFKNPSRQEDAIGLELDDGTITDHWTHVSDSDDKNKKPLVAKVSREVLIKKEQEILNRLKDIKKEKLSKSSKKTDEDLK